VSAGRLLTLGLGANFSERRFLVTLGLGPAAADTGGGVNPYLLRQRNLQAILNDDEEVIQLFNQMLPQIIMKQLERKR